MSILTLAVGLLSGFSATSLAWLWNARRSRRRDAFRCAARASDPAGENHELTAWRRTYRELEKRAQQCQTRADAAETELAALASAVSHDLRAPLRGINGFSQALSEDYGHRLDATARDYLRRVTTAGAQMNVLIDDLLSLARVARAPFHPERVDLSALANAIARELSATDPARTVRWEMATNLSAVADRELVAEALRQLLTNAWKFTAARSRAVISFGAVPPDPDRSDGLVYQVGDNGIGFDMQYAGKLFGAFQRMHTVEESSLAGRGIGLALVQRIVQRHGGRVWAKSLPEQGATFSFSLETAASQSAADDLMATPALASYAAVDGARDASFRKTSTV